MFASNQSPIPTVSPRPLLSTTPPDAIEENGPRSSLESIDPIDRPFPSTIKQPGRNLGRMRSNSGNPKKCCFGLCCCPYVHVSLTRHFRRVAILLTLCAIINVFLCTYYAYIDANQATYSNHPENYWQSCIVYAENDQLRSAGLNAHFSLSAAAAGQQTVIFSMLATVTLYRALAHPEWLVRQVSGNREATS